MSTRSFPTQPVSGPRSRSRGPVGGEFNGRSRLPASPARPQGIPSVVRRRPDASRTASTPTDRSSSSGSPLLDRNKAPSSRTSLEDNRHPSQRGREREGAIRDVRDVGGGGDGEELQPTDQGSISGHGYDLWTSVTSLASKLTLNVNQAWQNSALLTDGEETPPGEESRLTKAMKAYHLERARSPADLPTWLFEDHERGVGSRTWNKQQEGYEDQFSLKRQADPTQRGGLRDVYDRATSSPALSTLNKQEGESGQTRATDRLRAIRDAKRLAAQSSSKSDVLNEGRGSTEATEADRRVIPARIGLPSGPGRMRRS